VNASIAHWHGGGEFEAGLDKFDELIRTTFREDIAQAFRGSRVPYVFVLLVSIWPGFYQMDRIGPPKLYHCNAARSYDCHCTFNKAEVVKGVLNLCKTGGTLPRSLEVIHSIFLVYPLNIALFIRVVVIIWERVPKNAPWALQRLMDFILAIAATGILLGFVKLGFELLRGKGPRQHPIIGISFMILEACVVYILYRRSVNHQPDPLAKVEKGMVAAFDLAHLSSLQHRISRLSVTGVPMTGVTTERGLDEGLLPESNKRTQDTPAAGEGVSIEMAAVKMKPQETEPAGEGGAKSSEPPPYF